MQDKLFSSKGIDHHHRFSFVGYGIDANAIYAIHQTTYTIARGIITEDEFIGYCTEDGRPYTSCIRRH